MSLPVRLRATCAAVFLLAAGGLHATDVAHGESLYKTVCAACHNPGGNPGPGPIQLGAWNADAIAAALENVIEMNDFESLFTRPDLEDIAAYLGVKFGIPPPGAAPATISASPTGLSFGNVTPGQTSATQMLTVSNTGSAQATGIGFANSDATEFAVTGNTCGPTLNAGASCTLNVEYAPTAAGSDNASLTISYSGRPDVIVALSGTGTGPATSNLAVAPAAINFGNVAVGSTSPMQAVTVSNTGSAAASGIALVNSNSAEFVVSANNCGSTLNAGASCSLSIDYAPSGAGGDSATLTFNYDGGGVLSVTLSGTGVASTTPPGTATSDAIEYHHAAFDHYFITAIADEITKLDNDTFAGWARTGRQFKVFAASGTALSAVCRFFSTSFAPKSSHFYTASASECTVVKANPDWPFEAEVFFVATPAADGTCGAGTIPVYRLYNNGQGSAPNHRFTTDLGVRAGMMANGWIAEGFGIGVTMCVPP